MNRKQNSLMRFSRTERLAQLSEQEIVIERKKREIQAKLEAQKKKQTEEALKKLESSKEAKNKPGFFKKSAGTGLEHEKSNSKDKPVEQLKESLTNAFSNDGSFLDQFKRLSQTGLSPNYANMQTLSMTKKMEEDFKQNQDANEGDISKLAKDNERDKKDCIQGSSNNQSFFSKESLDSKIQQQPPTPGIVQLASQHQGVSGVTSSTDKSTSKTSESVPVSKYQNAAPNPPLVLNSGTKLNCPPSMCLDLNSRNPDVLHNNTLTNTHSLVQPPVSPEYVLPSISNQVQNIPSHVSPSELPKVRSESISMTLKSNTVKKLEAIPNPLEVDQAPSPTSENESQFSFKEKTEGLNTSNFNTTSILENVASQNKGSSRVSSAFYNDDEDKEESDDHLDQNLHYWAELVSQYGDQFEDSLRSRKENDESTRFLLDKNSKEYLSYRKLVLKYRKRLKVSEQEPSDKMHIENCDSEELLSSGSTVSGMQQEAKAHSKNCWGQAEETSAENSKDGAQSPEIKTEERRKRKRKSRWGDAVPTTSTPNLGNLNLQPPGKIPAPKSALLSQLTRSDPGLIQYARQTFGSTDLSEEDWKKAEDHYKINLLYQDMVKKRAEVEKLERQGKFKYEYDSDEDTEGGTWEHKLRKQEMQATQLWAEELTRQAAGKHHIGDFLPPEELERFMEKYNAVKEGREPDLSDYKEYKLKQDNVGYRLLQKMGWNEGQGLGQDGTGITNPVNKATTRHENQGLGVERPDGLTPGDDEYDAYRKRMMLAYRFRPNPLNNPRRPYY